MRLSPGSEQDMSPARQRARDPNSASLVRGLASAAADAIVGALLYRALARTPPTTQHGADGLFDIVFTDMAAPDTHNIASERQGGHEFPTE
jgi:hypothetical protein